MGDIGTIWFVARDEETVRLWSIVSCVAVNPFTKQTSELTTLRLHPTAVTAQEPSYSRDGLMAQDVADLLYIDDALVPFDVGDDALYRFNDNAVHAFAKIPTTELPRRLETWNARMLRRGVPMANAELATFDEATKLHALAVHAREHGGSLYGWVQLSGR